MAATATTSSFINTEKLYGLARADAPRQSEIHDILAKARELKGLSMEEAARLINVQDRETVQQLLETARYVKSEIYGKRMVMFAPLYTGNHCNNNCLYCGFRKDNKELKRVKLTQDQIACETEALLKQGHKRVLLLSGESGAHPLKYTMESLETVYKTTWKGQSIRRINVEIAPLSVDDFRTLKTGNIGTYTCFQETYDSGLYGKYHLSGPKADYNSRLTVMDRAMEAGIDDVGIGALYGLGDYRFETLAMMAHASHLEERFGCGPHTVSVPRMEPAPGAPVANQVPYPVSDLDFMKLVAVIRISLPYTGIILSTRETAEMRTKLFQYGISQVSAGSHTDPGGYSGNERKEENSQFSLGDHRNTRDVIYDMVKDGYIPSFCTGCYRMGRQGNDFMDLAKPGLIKHYCTPNGMTSFAEYLEDFADDELKTRGYETIQSMMKEEVPDQVKPVVTEALNKIKGGTRDIYL